MAIDNDKRRVLLGVCGSIAAYKAAEFARILISRGFEVRTVMTASAQEFIHPNTFEAITGNPVMLDFWESSGIEGIEHITLADWADVLVVAPATADTLSKMVIGAADTPLLATILATKAPVLVAPAMNVNMWEHPATQENIMMLRKRGVEILAPEEGALACGWNGAGRLAAPWQILYDTQKLLSPGDFKGKRVVITTGPTREAIDPVRFISNRSSGKMGVTLAREAYRRGAQVTLIHGPATIKVPTAVNCIPVVTAEEMRAAVLEHTFSEADPADIIIMAAAVSDFSPAESKTDKIKKANGLDQIKLKQNPDILAEVGVKRSDQRLPIMVGFAVETGETEELLDEVRRKLKDKKADMIVGNNAADALDRATNHVWLVDRAGKIEEVLTTYKSRVAVKVFDGIARLI